MFPNFPKSAPRDHNGVLSMNYQQSSASPEFASQGSSSGREFCLWNFKGVVLILVDRLCVLVVWGPFFCYFKFPLNLGAVEMGENLEFSLAQKEEIFVRKRSISPMCINSNNPL